MTVLFGFGKGNRSRLPRFFLHKSPFAGNAPTVPGNRAIGANDAMAGDGDGDGVGRDGGGDRANGLWQTNACGDFGVSGGAAGWDFAEGVPHALLEGSAANVQREITRA